jgi:hypothetical protein
MRIWLRLGMVALLLLVLVSAVQAQEGDQSLIEDYAGEVIFPAALRFQLRMTVEGAALSSVSLEVSQGEVVLFSGDLDLEVDMISTVPFALLRYDLPLNPIDPPILFEPVTYRWTVTDRDGVTQEAEGEVAFEPQGESWRQSGEEPLRFSLFSPDLNIVAARQAIEPVYELMREHTGLSPSFKWAVFPPGHVFCTEAEDENGERVYLVYAQGGDSFPCSEADAEHIFLANGYRLLRRHIPGLVPFRNELIADMFSVFYGDYWRGQNVPDWFRSGLEQLYYLTPNPLALNLVQDASRADRLFEGARLDTAPDDEQARSIWKSQVYTLVLYLADAYGAGAPFTLAQAVPEEGFASAFRRVTGGDLDGFLAGWERWLFSDAAGRAVAWTPYTPPTPTLPPTPTSTPVPPTATPTATATNTLPPSVTPTATPGVVQIASPLPTFTPFTPIPPTPSNTPRPPGSLNQPPSGGSGSGGGGGICPAVLPGLLLPLVALVAVQRRRGLS